MNNGLCPECGVEMDLTEVGYGRDDNDEPVITGEIYSCPACGYEETTYDA